MERTDAELVVAASSGDHDAFGLLYDRYGARIYDLCAHMLRDRDEAADATADVFVRAHEHLAQLREPEKCKSWLYAIARNEVYRRTKRRSRETVVDMTDDLVPAADSTVEVDALDPEALTGLVREAALGLDERDRLVLELTLAGGLEGRELGEALGVSENGAHQAAHRMRERMARSVGALLVARQGRADCAQLAVLLESWDGTFSVLWRKRVARHVDGCETCERRRKAIPTALFSGTAFAALPVSHLSPPDFIRQRVLERTQGGATQTRGFKRDGFPRDPGSGPRTLAIVSAIAAVVAAIVLVAAVAGGTSHDGRVAVAAPITVPGDTTAASTATGASSTIAGSTSVPASTPTDRTPIVVAPTNPATHLPTGGTTPVTTPGGGTTPPTTPLTDPPTTAGDTAGPALQVMWPETLSFAACGGSTFGATASDPSGVASVRLRVDASGPTVDFTQTGPTTWSASWAPPTSGTYSLHVTAVDGRGNTSSAGTSIATSVCIT